MALSKPVYNFLGFYFEQLFNHPLRTKAITSSVIAGAGAITSQKINGQPINTHAIFAYVSFAGFIGAPFSHYFYEFIARIVPDVRFKRILEFLIERFTFAPIFCGLSLYCLTLLEGKSPEEAQKNLLKLYKTVLLANWKYLSLPVFLNFNFCPVFLRVFAANIIGFFWIVYMANKRRQAAATKKEK